MAFSRDLTSRFDSFEIFLSNHNIESSLSDDHPHSSASHFANVLNLDLIPLIFLKSTTARIALAQVSLSSLALCFLSTEKIRVKIVTPPSINECNHIATIDTVSEQNHNSLLISFCDYSATNSQECLTHVNHLLSDNLNAYLIYKLSFNFFDMNVFKENIFVNLSPDNKITLSQNDLHILLYYINITLYTRRQLNSVLKGQPNPPEKELTANLSNHQSFNKGLEQTTLSKSKYLLNLDERKNMLENYVFKTLEIEQFYDINIHTKSDARDALDVKITTAMHDYFINILELDLDNPTPEHTKQITSLLKSNNDLIKQGLTLQQIILFQTQKLTNNFDPHLFNTDLVRLKLDHTGAKVCFEISNKSYLPPDETSCEISFDPTATYTLGSLLNEDNNQQLTIGPFSHANDCSLTAKEKPLLTNRIKAGNQRLHGPIRYTHTHTHTAIDVIRRCRLFF